jgi:hypothetical protein
VARAFRKAQSERRTIVWVDESAFNPLPAVVRTYAPRGETPILDALLTHDHLSVISGLTQDGRLLLQIRERAFRGPAVVDFLRHLLRQLPGPLLVVWDGATIHRAQPVKDFPRKAPPPAYSWSNSQATPQSSIPTTGFGTI